ncbi:hypothetical protein PR048_008372 [Dryococelus australis]|uniref:Uncharacterized protein n=1 Tax=Dryococelus australis TaxID=614101 RepID=A0ABQ9HYL2_9NEOP|nr:hypothetical protein PR048_008372 [Dryococelus australis]
MIPKNEQRQYRAQEIQCEMGNECYRNIYDSMDDNLLDSSFVLTDSQSDSESGENAEDVGVQERYSLYKSFSETLGLCFISHSIYYKIVKKYVTPTIRMAWLGEQRYLET